MPEPLEQMNVRFKERRVLQARKLAKTRGETLQALFDRLVLDEARRNPDVILGEIATARAALDQEEAELREDLEL